MVIGPPASGKSRGICRPVAVSAKARIVDSDEAKEIIGEDFADWWDGGRYAALLHDESDQVAATVVREAVARRENLVLPRIGRTPATMDAIRQALQEAGYQVTLVLVDLPAEEAARRAVERFREAGGGRFVDPAYVLHDIGSRPRETYAILKNEGNFDAYEAYSNNVSRREPPIRIDNEF